MFNYNLLDDKEFELLCKDIMSRKLGKTLYNFPRGRDGGIDISDEELYPTVVIQVKHYTNSTVSNLLGSLRKEIPKLENLKPENYFVFTSLGLTRTKRVEIINMFPTYMKNLENVITKEEIDDFLNNPSNEDILNKHKNLWIQSVNILSQFKSKIVNMDSYSLLNDIEQRKFFYIKTSSYEEALKKIDKNSILIITGNPGVGKTTLCELIVLEYLKSDYRLIYASTSDLDTVKESMLLSKESKQIILLDDFLGQHYLKINETKSAELKSLLSFSKTLENTKFLLNSRITILNEARQKDYKFTELHEEYVKYELNLDMDYIPDNDKFKILDSHLTYNEIPQNYLEYLKAENRFLNVINHNNFNPRIIEYVSKYKKNIERSEDSYYKFILSKLDNPQEVWQDEFENRIEPIDRIFLYILYSLSEGRATNEDLKLAFDKRICNENSIDKTINNYERILKRLSNSLIRISEGYYGVEISTINPSLNEYIHKVLQKNTDEQRMILENAYFYDQITTAVDHEVHRSRRVEKLFNPKILSHPTSFNYKNVYAMFLREVIKFQVLDISLSNKLKTSINNLGKKYSSDSDDIRDILHTLIYDDDYEIYDVINVIIESNNLENILSFIDSEYYLIDLFEKCYYQKKYLSESFIKTFKNHFNKIIIHRLSFVFRLNTFGIDINEELKLYKQDNLTNNEDLLNNFINYLYNKAKDILISKIILEYVDTKFEIIEEDFSEIINKIFTKEDIKLALTDSFEKRFILRGKIYVVGNSPNQSSES